MEDFRKAIIIAKGRANPWSFRINVFSINKNNEYKLIQKSPVLNVQSVKGLHALKDVFGHYLSLGKVVQENLTNNPQYVQSFYEGKIKKARFTLVNDKGDKFVSRFIAPELIEMYDFSKAKKNVLVKTLKK